MEYTHSHSFFHCLAFPGRIRRAEYVLVHSFLRSEGVVVEHERGQAPFTFILYPALGEGDGEEDEDEERELGGLESLRNYYLDKIQTCALVSL